MEGEIYLGGPTLMDGYCEEKNIESIMIDGWLRTGDRGFIDDSGYIYITGRRKNTIVMGNGLNISPEKIECELLRSGIFDSVIVFQNNVYRGQSIDVNVLTSVEHHIVNKTVEKYNLEHNMSYSISHIYYYPDVFELTTSRKINRNATIANIKYKIVSEKVCEIFLESFPELKVTELTNIFEELYIDSFALLSIICEIEKEFCIEFDVHALNTKPVISDIVHYVIEEINKVRI